MRPKLATKQGGNLYRIAGIYLFEAGGKKPGILRERVKAGILQARQRGIRHGRPPTVAHWAQEVRHLSAAGLSKSAIARQLGISRTSVRRFLGSAVLKEG